LISEEIRRSKGRFLLTMLNGIERLTSLESAYIEDWKKAVTSAWSDIQISGGKHGIDPRDINICVVYCPLYAQGSLRESKLLNTPAGISDSRVVNKNFAYSKVIASLSEYSKKISGGLKLFAVFANKGVLLAGEPSEKDLIALDYHDTLYKTATLSMCKQLGIEYSFSNYENLDVDFPVFVDPSAPLPKEIEVPGNAKAESIMINILNSYLKLPHTIVDNKKNRKIIERILNMEGLGFNGAFWLIAGYLAFDYKISPLVGENGILLAAERFEPLFGIAKMTPSLSELTRINIKA